MWCKREEGRKDGRGEQETSERRSVYVYESERVSEREETYSKERDG